MSGAIALTAQPAQAQSITFDGTLGTPRTLTGPNYVIRQGDGVVVDRNLFHSFDRFGLTRNETIRETVRFESDGTVHNILARVTGGFPSHINGRISTSSSAVNLFLINPSGIVFGPNASLQIGGVTRGSFVATTVDTVVWPNGRQFSAATPGDRTSLLNIVGDPSGFLATLPSPGSISSMGSMLRVPAGQQLMLLGGQVNLDHTQLGAAGGQVVVAGLATNGQLDLTTDGNALYATIPEGSPRADVTLSNGSGIAVASTNPNANSRIQLLGRSLTLNGDTTLSTNSGMINLNADAAATLENASLSATSIRNGSAGSISLTAGDRLSLLGSNIRSNTRGAGDAGEITLRAANGIEVRNSEVRDSNITSTTSGFGSGGTIALDTSGEVAIVHSTLTAQTSAAGHAGNINVRADRAMTVDGGSIVTASGNSNGNPLGNAGTITLRTGNLAFLNTLLSTETTGEGRGGDIDVETTNGSLTVLNSQLQTSASSRGDAGNSRITVDGAVNISGMTTSTPPLPAGLISSTTGSGRAGNITLSAPNHTVRLFNHGVLDARTEASGNGGEIQVTANRLEISSGGGILTSTVSRGTVGGDAGGVAIATPHLILQDRGQIVSSSTGSGIAGDLDIAARRVSLRNQSRIAAETAATTGGNITLRQLERLDVNQSSISASTQTGQAGNVQIDARDTVQLTGTGGIAVAATAGGDAGTLTLNTRQLNLEHGARATVSSTGAGSAGAFNVRANTVWLNHRAGLTAETEAGQGGNIRLQVGNGLTLQNRSQISASTQSGQGGNVTITGVGTGQAVNAVSVQGSRILAQASGSGNAGRVTVNARTLALHQGSDISAATVSGQGGGVTLRGLAALQVDNSQISASTETGQAGNLSVNAATVQVQNGGRLSVAATRGGQAGNLTIRAGEVAVTSGAQATVSSPTGQAGNLTIAANRVRLDRGQLTAQTGANGGAAGANIRLHELDQLVLRRGSQISADAGDRANGGNIQIGANFVVAVPSEDSNIRANAIAGRGGTIVINTNGVFGIQPAAEPIPDTSDITASSEQGVQGVVQINTPDVDPSQGLTELPAEVVDASTLIARSCASYGSVASPERSMFVMTGRGGLPLNPTDALSPNAVVTHWIALADGGSGEREGAIAPIPLQPSTVSTPPDAPITEAQGWVMGANGAVTLVAQAPTVTAQQLAFASAGCHS